MAIVSIGALVALSYGLSEWDGQTRGVPLDRGQQQPSAPTSGPSGTGTASAGGQASAPDDVAGAAVEQPDGAKNQERTYTAHAVETRAHATPRPSISECPASMQLVGSVVNVAKPERSLAAVHLRGGTRVAHPGAILGGYELVEVARRRAYLRGPTGTACVLRAASTSHVATTTPNAEPRGGRAKVAPAEQLSPEQLKAGVRQLDPHTFAVSRAVLEQALANPAALRRAGRFRPTTNPNGPTGLTLTRVGKSSVLGALGLQKGDVLTQLNGNALSDVSGAFSALRDLRAAGRVSVSLARNGGVQTLTYVVQ
jgi:type II secretory pathway component PulC